MENMGRKKVLTQIIKDRGSCFHVTNCGGCPIVCGDSPYWTGDYYSTKFWDWKYEQALKFYLEFYKIEDIMEVLL